MQPFWKLKIQRQRFIYQQLEISPKPFPVETIPKGEIFQNLWLQEEKPPSFSIVNLNNEFNSLKVEY